MFKEGLKDLTVTKLSEETGIEIKTLHDYINYATPIEYDYGRDRATGAGEPPYLLREKDIELLAIIHELAQTYSLSEIKEKLEETDINSHNTLETIIESEDLEVIEQSKDLVVPQVIADFADEYKENKKPIVHVLLNPDTKKEKNLASYVFNNNVDEEEQVKRQDMLFDVLANGYDKIEEMKFRVIFEDNDAGFFLYKADDVSVTISNDLDNYNEYEDRILLTEKEVHNYDSRFMIFSHPEL